MGNTGLGVFEISYVEEKACIYDIYRCIAEDELHAEQKFNSRYPTSKIVQIEYRGEA